MLRVNTLVSLHTKNDYQPNGIRFYSKSLLKSQQSRKDVAKMFKITAICDKCQKSETQDGKYFTEKKDGYQAIEIKISQYETKGYLFCKECRGELGLIKAEGAKEVTVESVEERLLNVICEIVASELDNRG